jgi:hypothetical protein
MPKLSFAPPSNQNAWRRPPQEDTHVDGQNLAPNIISTKNKAANDTCPAKAHPQPPFDSNTTNNTGNTTGFPNALPLTTPPPRTYAAMASAKPKFPARSTKASNLNIVFSLIPPEGPADDLTAEQKNKMTRATLRIQHLLNFPGRMNKGSVTAVLHKWKQHILYYITETANTTAIKVGARAGKNISIETSAAGAQHTYTKIKHTDTIQCFLKGPTHETYTSSNRVNRFLNFAS